MQRTILYIFLVGSSALFTVGVILYLAIQNAPKINNLLLSNQTAFLAVVITSSISMGVIGFYSIHKRVKLRKSLKPLIINEDACGILKFIGTYGCFTTFVASDDLGLDQEVNKILKNYFLSCLQNLLVNKNKEDALVSLKKGLVSYIPRKSSRETISLLLLDAAMTVGFSNEDYLKILKEV